MRSLSFDIVLYLLRLPSSGRYRIVIANVYFFLNLFFLLISRPRSTQDLSIVCYQLPEATLFSIAKPSSLIKSNEGYDVVTAVIVVVRFISTD